MTERQHVAAALDHGRPAPPGNGPPSRVVPGIAAHLQEDSQLWPDFCQRLRPVPPVGDEVPPRAAPPPAAELRRGRAEHHGRVLPRHGEHPADHRGGHGRLPPPGDGHPVASLERRAQPGGGRRLWNAAAHGSEPGRMVAADRRTMHQHARSGREPVAATPRPDAHSVPPEQGRQRGRRDGRPAQRGPPLSQGLGQARQVALTDVDDAGVRPVSPRP
jgi:hypothetical protein